MRPSSTFVGIILLAASAAPQVTAGGPDEPPLERRFDEVVRPFLRDHCLACHGSKKQQGKLDLSGYSSAADVLRKHRAWDVVLDRLEAEEMPPEEAKRQPTPHERRAVIEWIRALREREARRNAGDPGPVLARRLSHAEFDYTIRDLTGVDIRPTREFPVDPANEAGFDNSGESLKMSPALVKKYLAAARLVADHLVLKPTDSTSRRSRRSRRPTATSTASAGSSTSTNVTGSITPTTSSPPGSSATARASGGRWRPFTTSPTRPA
jgi:hypothetical protein